MASNLLRTINFGLGVEMDECISIELFGPLLTVIQLSSFVLVLI